MSVITLAAPKTEVAKAKFTIIGKAWKNVVKKEGPTQGLEYISVKLNQEVASFLFANGLSVCLWPNKKREGKNDADYSLAIAE